jgi:hypothetical protein
MTLVKTYSMEDVGTRMQHMMDLQDLWSFAYAVLTTPNIWHSERENVQAMELAVGIDLLNYHLQAEYKDTPYARVINGLPKPNDETST